MEKIAFIGTGIMGKPMVRNLLKAGYTLHIYARHPEKVADLVTAGAKLFPSIKECLKGVEKVITIVGFPEDVKEVYFAKENILASATEGTYLIDMTTTSPKLAIKIYEKGKKRGLHVLDAPVTGGDIGAEKGTLSILVGGDLADYQACLPLFKVLGNNINYQGSAGKGQHAKMANQIMIAATLSGVCEALTYAKAKGLDLAILLKSVASGAAGSKQLEALAPKILQEDYTPGFYIRHFIKDMQLAAQEAQESELNLEILTTVLAHYRQLEKAGLGSYGTQALMEYYR